MIPNPVRLAVQINHHILSLGQLFREGASSPSALCWPSTPKPGGRCWGAGCLIGGTLFCLADAKKDQMARLKRNLGPARVGTYEVACLWLVLSAQTGDECSRPPERRQQQCTIEILHIVNASCAPVTLSEA